MTEALLALIPTYGVWFILVSVVLSCLALPVPSSMMVMVAGGFAATGDFAFWSLAGFAFAGFVIGDQIAFWLSRRLGKPLLTGLERRPRSAGVIHKARELLERRGLWAVLLSRTVLSPLGPYVGYLSGALGMPWLRFTAMAVLGAMTWSMGYAWLGFTFSDQITQIADLISNSVGIIMAGAVALGGLAWMRRTYRRSRRRG
ncbi:DedA family protein [Oceanicola sp. S124]|uniref:DedA family protein n=1 Tax=Oceanicola sp. S124 TaxID=1042378 RepID=UPI0002558C5C|nr:DedA family protein [Oceanicola sp. S124]